MGETERYTEFKRRKLSLGDDKNSLMTLVIINAIIFTALAFIKILFYIVQSGPGSYEPSISKWFVLPADISQFIVRPWTLVSYMFTHTNLMVAFTNMIWLWTFGSVFQTVAGNRKVMPVYVYGGLAGAVAFIAINYIIPSLRAGVTSHALEGANASIMAIAVAATTLVPGYRFFRMMNGGIPIWVLTLIYIAIDLAGIAGSNPSYYATHLAGAAIGFLFIKSLQRGYDWSLWMNNARDSIMNLFNPDKNAPRNKIRETIFYKTDKQKPFVKKPVVTQQRIDTILDKINQKGYDSLSEEEKTILKKAGEADI